MAIKTARQKRNKQLKIVRDIKGRFLKKGRKRAPLKYKRPIPPGMYRLEVSLSKQLLTGDLLEFVYGRKQKPWQVGGWKHDRKPVLLVFWDDGKKYIEGINTNYLSGWYLRKLTNILDLFPGIDGQQLYIIVKRSAKFAIQKGYRKYIRTSLRNRYLYMYTVDEDEMFNKTKIDVKEYIRRDKQSKKMKDWPRDKLGRWVAKEYKVRKGKI